MRPTGVYYVVFTKYATGDNYRQEINVASQDDALRVATIQARAHQPGVSFIHKSITRLRY